MKETIYLKYIGVIWISSTSWNLQLCHVHNTPLSYLSMGFEPRTYYFLSYLTLLFNALHTYTHYILNSIISHFVATKVHMEFCSVNMDAW